MMMCCSKCIRKRFLLQMHEFYDVTVVALINRANPLSRQKSASIHELLKLNVVTACKHELKDTETYVRLLDYLTEETRFTPTANLHAFYLYLQSGEYVCFVPKENLAKERIPHHQQLVALELEDIDPQLHFAIVTNENADFSPAQRYWLCFLENYFRIKL